MDNGFLLFNNVKVPHVNMLARFSRIDKETNHYAKPAMPSLVFGTLTWVRSNIVLQAGGVLARGVTIATRYCAVRRQFQDRDADAHAGENQVLNYKMVQVRLLPLLASMYALHFTGRGMMRLYEQNQSQMKAANSPGQDSRGAGPEELRASANLLADLHATSCGLKALASTTAGEGLEVCRRACGGHGYSSYSGIGAWYSDYLPTLTWEGDNYMLTQQVARYVCHNLLIIPFWSLETNTIPSFSNLLVPFSLASLLLTTLAKFSRPTLTDATRELPLMCSKKTRTSWLPLPGVRPT
jgi:acyl-CoA oxidase